MKYGGKVAGGVVVLDSPSALPDGAVVAVEPLVAAREKLTRAEVLEAINRSSLRFTKSWDEIKVETR